MKYVAAGSLGHEIHIYELDDEMVPDKLPSFKLDVLVFLL